MFSDIKLLYLTQDSGYTPSCFTGWFLGKCLYFTTSKLKLKTKNMKLEKDSSHHYCICSLVTIPPKKHWEKRGKRSILWMKWVKLQRQLKCLTLNKREERHGCVTILLLPWKALGITLLTIPLPCFCFATLYLTRNNFKRSQAQHQTAEWGSYHNFLESLKAEPWAGRCQQRPRAGPTPPREKRAGDHGAMAKAALFFQAHAAPPMDKKTAFLWWIWGWQSLPALLLQFRVLWAAWSTQGAAGLEALGISLI